MIRVPILLISSLKESNCVDMSSLICRAILFITARRVCSVSGCSEASSVLELEEVESRRGSLLGLLHGLLFRSLPARVPSSRCIISLTEPCLAGTDRSPAPPLPPPEARSPSDPGRAAGAAGRGARRDLSADRGCEPALGGARTPDLDLFVIFPVSSLTALSLDWH